MFGEDTRSTSEIRLVKRLRISAYGLDFMVFMPLAVARDTLTSPYALMRASDLLLSTISSNARRFPLKLGRIVADMYVGSRI